jgi:hypothetical protein
MGTGEPNDPTGSQAGGGRKSISGIGDTGGLSVIVGATDGLSVIVGATGGLSVIVGATDGLSVIVGATGGLSARAMPSRAD